MSRVLGSEGTLDWFDQWDIGKLAAALGAPAHRRRARGQAAGFRGSGSRIKPLDGPKGFSPCFHLPGFHGVTLFWTHTQLLGRRGFRDGDMDEFYRGRAQVETARGHGSGGDDAWTDEPMEMMTLSLKMLSRGPAAADRAGAR